MRPPTHLAIIVLVTAAGCSGSAAPTTAPTTAPTAARTVAPSFAPAAVTVYAHGEDGGVSFTPATIEIKAGDVLQLVDVGDTLHDFTIDVGGTVPKTPADQHIAVQIPVDLVNVTNQAAINLPPGTYKFYCSVSLGNGAGHAVNGMVGTITIH
jgi:plastocyanin